MGDKDSRTERSGLRTDHSSESLESLPNREEYCQNIWIDSSKPGRPRLKSTSMSDLDVEYHPSDNMQESRDRKSVSVSDLEEKPHVGANMQNYVPLHSVYRMGSTEPSLAESGFVAEGSCWPTPSESLKTFNDSEERISICENLWMNSLHRRHLDRKNTGGTESSLMEFGSVTESSSMATNSDPICNIKEQNDSSESPSKMPLCLGESAESEDKGKKELSRCVKSWIQKYSVPIICFLVGGLIVFFAVFLPVYLLRTCPPVHPACPNKWTRSNEKCFFVSQATKDWNSSLEFCKSDGGTLLPAGNEMLQEIGSLHNLVGNDYWIGLNKDTDSEEWKQLNGSVWPWPIKHDHPKMSCSCINSGEYVALDCSTSRHWICVKSL